MVAETPTRIEGINFLSSWAGRNWVLDPHSTPNTTIWTPENGVQEPGYSQNVKKYSDIVSSAVSQIAQIFPETPNLHVELAVFPDYQYRESMRFSDVYGPGITSCFRQGKLCYNHVGANKYPETFSEFSPQNQVVEIHEAGHPVINEIVLKKRPVRTLEESLVQVIPQFLLGYQSQLTDNTQYIVGQLPEQLIEPLTLDSTGNFFKLSQNGTLFNNAYMSATMFTLGVMLNLDVDLHTAFHKLIDIVKNSSNETVYQSIAQTLGLTLEEVQNGRTLQLQAIDYVREHYTSDTQPVPAN